ncbi:MAG: hypothetical protein OEY06_11570 [Gammaproteobacteria bacterium]|nr:hypothetical protein [Gammaproteobacteria bacterium]
MDVTFIVGALFIFSILYTIVILIIRLRHKPTPERLIKDIDRQIVANTVPAYMLIERLEEALKEEYPDHPLLIQKIHELKTTAPPSQQSHKLLFGILSIGIGLLGLIQLYFYFIGQANLYGFVLGVAFIIGSYLIYRQYRVL